MSAEADIREAMVRLSRSLFDRGYAHGSAGNISARVEDGVLVSPTNSSMGRLTAETLSKLSPDGTHLSGDKPSKEAALHLGVLAARPEAGGVVHLHSTYATLLSCLSDTDPADAMPPITPYLVMRVGRVPMVPYFAPGSDALAAAVSEKARDHRAVLMANHGFVVTGRSFEDAVMNAEEFEENARLLFLTRDMSRRLLDNVQLGELLRKFGAY
jgi:ribulose-5-phosphate 4-epimerase/fuculose-1-phosphate aldolase